MKKKLDLKKETIATLKKEEENRLKGGNEYIDQIGKTNVTCWSIKNNCPKSHSCIQNGMSCLVCW